MTAIIMFSLIHSSSYYFIKLISYIHFILKPRNPENEVAFCSLYVHIFDGFGLKLELEVFN